MRELRVIAVGRIGRGAEAELFARYAARLSSPPLVTEIGEARGSAGEVKRRESAALLAALPAQAFVVALDLGGPAPTSPGLATQLSGWRELGRPVCFLLGGAEGLDAEVIGRADCVLSLGPLTWPHLLARAMLAEQLFRAQSIAANHPYHRAGRP